MIYANKILELLTGTLSALSLSSGVQIDHDESDLYFFEEVMRLQDESLAGVTTQQDATDIETLGFLFSTMDSSVELTVPLNEQSKWLDGFSNYRNIPGVFPEGMDYYFDGLATLSKFQFKDDNFSMFTRNYHSRAFDEWDKCIFFGSGTGPTRPASEDEKQICFKNPLVMMLPKEGKMWLTIDTRSWGVVDMETLETLQGVTDAPGMTLNAHPACDRISNQCFVQYPCPTDKHHILNEKVCVGEVEHQDQAEGFLLHVKELSRQNLGRKKLIQHSHSPCVTPNFVVAKLDEFQPVNPKNDKGGLLKVLHQGEVNEWMVMDRRDNSSRLLTSDKAFVNNHFWNCYEEDDGVNVQTVAVTSDYLDMYFKSNLPLNEVPEWRKRFLPVYECKVPFEGSNISCEVLTTTVFDYPTFNPYYKMNPNYKFFYAIGPRDIKTSTFFDRLIKFDGKTGNIVKEWYKEGIYLTEANFFPRGDEHSAEDDGALFTIAYNSTENLSYAYIFDAVSLDLIDSYSLGTMVPFHAHGVTCTGETCFSNP